MKSNYALVRVLVAEDEDEDSDDPYVQEINIDISVRPFSIAKVDDQHTTLFYRDTNEHITLEHHVDEVLSLFSPDKARVMN